LKKVTFYSFGHSPRFKEFYPKPPRTLNIWQFVFDVRCMICETYNADVPDSGLKESMRKIVITGVRRNGYLSSLKKIIQQSLLDLILLKTKEDKELRFYFGCLGGWQRSVALAEYFKELCQKIVTHHRASGQIEVRVRHLTIGEFKVKAHR
jgi:RNase adaptor protein for sRNA GlmZ degradation